MKSTLLGILSWIPGGDSILRTSRYYKHKILFKDKEKLFTFYYKTNAWGSQESVSGYGSTIKYTENIRKEIPGLIRQLGVHRILDAPCGDYNWFRLIPRGKSVHYVGGDIVETLITRNQQLFANENTCFVKLDITKDGLPDADLWLCRDCLFHLSNEDIFNTIDNFFRSDIRYFLTSTHTRCSLNTDILTGCFRQLNLELPPFSFCPPILFIDDWIEGYPVRKLGLWKRDMLFDALACNQGLREMRHGRR